MRELIVNHGARFRVGAAEAEDPAEWFVRDALLDRRVRRALGDGRWRLLHSEVHDELHKDGDSSHCEHCSAVFYDYSRNRAVHVTGEPGTGRFTVELSNEQPLPDPEEFAEAVSLVAHSRPWGRLLQAGYVRPYEPMPPVLEPEGSKPVERTLYVGLISRERQFNRIVAVNMVRQHVSERPSTPRASNAVARVCGVQEAECARPRRGTAGKTVIQWPAENPVWQFQAVRPAASSGNRGSGVELRNVRYKGVLVLKQAHVPILNVEYVAGGCGPYRDWLYSESCFEANGTNIPRAPGFRWCSEPPRTMFESGQDGGNFVGVAVYENSSGELCLVSQLSAGWYRYIMEWRFDREGRIMPRFRFGGTSNSCVCQAHIHHALWRLDFDVVDRANVLEELVGAEWQPVPRETSRRRKVDEEIRWRVRHARTQAAYEIVQGERDGIGDDYSGADLFALKYRGAAEITDGKTSTLHRTNTRLARYVNNESLVAKDLVVWYGAHYRHETEPEHALHEEVEVGPTLQPTSWPAP